MNWWPHRSPPLNNGSTQSPVQEAEDQFLNKQGKLRTAAGAILTGNLRQLAEDELASVRALKHKYGLGPAPVGAEGEAMGDLIVCDAYSRNDPPPSRIWPIMATLIAGAGIAVAGLVAWKTLVDKPSAAPAAVQPADPQQQLPPGFRLELIPPKKK